LDQLQTFRSTGGTCCKQIIYTVSVDNKLSSCKFIHGCSGNQQALARLCVGMPIDEIAEKLKGIPCKGNTSCPDQLARAMLDYKARQEKGVEKGGKEGKK